MKIGIFGGTFDPIHKGHLALASAALDQAGLDKVLFIPANIPPHKKDSHDMASAEDRYQMTAAAVKGHPGFQVSRIEIDRGGVSYTIDTVRELRERNPGARFYLILGQDALQDFPAWKSVDELKTMAGILVARRPGARLSKAEEAGVSWLDMPESSVASSSIREGIRRRVMSCEALPEPVRQYIHQKRLYKSASE